MADAGPSGEKAKPGPKKKAKAKGDAEEKPAKKGKAAADAKAAKADEEEQPVAATSFKGHLEKELVSMMFGFGDDKVPLKETVELVEEIVVEYVTSLLYKAMDSAVARGKGKSKVCPITAEDILFLVRKEPKKYARVRELLIKDEEIKNARKVFQEDEDLAPK